MMPFLPERTFSRCLSVLAGCALVLVAAVALPLRIATSEETAARETGVLPTTIGNIDQLIGEAVPIPPPPMRLTTEVFSAFQASRQLFQVNGTEDDLRIDNDIVYAQYEDAQVMLDLYQPRTILGKTAGVILIHGGAWITGSKDEYCFYGVELARRGYVVASIDYRMAPKHPFPAAVQDAKAAVRWLRANAQRLQVDPERLSVIGASAGGHLALMVGYSQGVPELEGTGGPANVSSDVSSVVAMYPPSDLFTIAPPTEESALLQMFLGVTRSEQPDTYRRASPVNYLNPADPPTLLLHGTVDVLVPISQSDELARKLEETRVPFVYDRLTGWPHSMDRIAPVNERCLWFIERFLSKTLTPAGLESL